MTVETTAANPRSIDSIGQFGEALRRERQRRSVSLEDISQTTKVTVRNLQALESDAFEKLPGGILGKGIVRSYVRCLGLNEGEWVERFLDASGQRVETNPVAEKDWTAFAINVSTNRPREVGSTRLRWAGVAALLLLLAGFGWVVWGYVHQRAASVSNASSIHNAGHSASALPAGIESSAFAPVPGHALHLLQKPASYPHISTVG